ncbi:MAG: M18 family aminopeptidase [Lachnospiraceae bacterium]|nr:M18 family aminopeptidase [Lachnospiraceae bacterium]
MAKTIAEKCLNFIDAGVSCYHVIGRMKKVFDKAGFQQLSEREKWDLQPGGSYYVERGGSSIMAFRIPKKEMKGFHIVASHSDSPSFKLKTNPEYPLEKQYLRLNTEGYGGMIYSTWFDRSLSVAGRVVYANDKGPVCVNVNIDKDLLVIPSLAIHMNREANKGMEFNPQVDLLPLMGSGEVKGYLEKELKRLSGAGKDEILGSDLYLYVREKGKIAGAEDELLISPRLDDLECVFGSMEAILASSPKEYCSVCAVFNNEEVGSLSRQGAASTFLKDTLIRIGEGFGICGSEYLRLIAGSFMISADNAHALHPNHQEKADVVNKPVLNGGIVVKHHGGQKYATDGYTEGVMKLICKKAGVPYQDYHNRSDIAGGSTLGNLSSAQVALPAVDIGLAQLAMHSAVETAGSRDIEYLQKALELFFGE